MGLHHTLKQSPNKTRLQKLQHKILVQLAFRISSTTSAITIIYPNSSKLYVGTNTEKNTTTNMIPVMNALKHSNGAVTNMTNADTHKASVIDTIPKKPTIL